MVLADDKYSEIWMLFIFPPQREEVVMFWMNKMRTLISLPLTRPGFPDTADLSDSGYGSGKGLLMAKAVQPDLGVAMLKRKVALQSDMSDPDSESTSSQDSDQDTGLGTSDGDDASSVDEYPVPMTPQLKIDELELGMLLSKLSPLVSDKRRFALRRCHPESENAPLNQDDCMKLERIINLYIALRDRETNNQHSLSGSDSSGSTITRQNSLSSVGSSHYGDRNGTVPEVKS